MMNETSIDIDETVLNGIYLHCVKGVIVYKCSQNATKYIKSIVNKLIIDYSEIQFLYLKINEPSFLYDLRLHGLIKFIYDEFCIANFDQIKLSKIEILPLLTVPNHFSGDILLINKELDHLNGLSMVMFGGTFDRLHFGHKSSILHSFIIAKSYFYIGITNSDCLIRNKSCNYLIQNYCERLNSVKEYLQRISKHTRKTVKIIVLDQFQEPSQLSKDDNQLSENDNPLQVVIFPLMSQIGPADSTSLRFILIVTDDTVERGEFVNDIRKEKGLPLWILLQLPMVGVPAISSTKLRDVDQILLQ